MLVAEAEREKQMLGGEGSKDLVMYTTGIIFSNSYFKMKHVSSSTFSRCSLEVKGSLICLNILTGDSQ